MVSVFKKASVWVSQFMILSMMAVSHLSHANDVKPKEALATLEAQTQLFQTGWLAAQAGELEKAYQVWSVLNQQPMQAPELSRAVQNNLAVLLIEQKNYLQAEKLLDSALQADRQVATTLENLNQLYTYQAQKTYQTLFSETAVVSPKGAFLYFDLAKRTAPTDNVVTQLQPRSEETLKQELSDSGAINQVKGALEGWRKSWASQDVKGYLSYYDSREFIPKQGLSYESWEKSRWRSLKNPKFIKVFFDDVQIVQLDKNLIRSRFLQRYHSNRFKDSVYKVLLWQLNDGQWKIVQEVVVSGQG